MINCECNKMYCPTCCERLYPHLYGPHPLPAFRDMFKEPRPTIEDATIHMNGLSVLEGYELKNCRVIGQPILRDCTIIGRLTMEPSNKGDTHG